MLGYILFVLLIRTSKCVPGCPDEEPNSPLLPAVAGVLRLPSYLFILLDSAARPAANQMLCFLVMALFQPFSTTAEAKPGPWLPFSDFNDGKYEEHRTMDGRKINNDIKGKTL